MFIITTTLFFITIMTELVSLYLQKKKQLFNRLFRKNAFLVHSVISMTLWSASGLSYVLLFLDVNHHPTFSCPKACTYIGTLLVTGGVVLSTAGFYQLGLKRSLHLNFFKENVPVEKKGVYKYVKNPEYCGFWSILLGVSLITGSLYFTTIFVELLVLMIILMWLENSIIKDIVPKSNLSSIN